MRSVKQLLEEGKGAKDALCGFKGSLVVLSVTDNGGSNERKVSVQRSTAVARECPTVQSCLVSVVRIAMVSYAWSPQLLIHECTWRSH